MELSFALAVSTETYFNRSSWLADPPKNPPIRLRVIKSYKPKPNTPWERAWKSLLKTGVKILVWSRGEQWKLPIKGERVTKILAKRSFSHECMTTKTHLLQSTFQNYLHLFVAFLLLNSFFVTFITFLPWSDSIEAKELKIFLSLNIYAKETQSVDDSSV